MPATANQPEKNIYQFAELIFNQFWNIIKFKHIYQPEQKEDNLNAADDGEASEESYDASNETQLGLDLDLLVSFNVVKGRRVKVDLDQLKSWWNCLTLIISAAL